MKSNQEDLFNPHQRARFTVEVVFDGGSKGRGFAPGKGMGYGSYRIDRQPIQRVNFNREMTAQAAEVLTLAQALQEVSKTRNAPYAKIVIRGDSQVALACASRLETKRKIKLKGSDEFQDAQMLLAQLVRQFSEIETIWHPRDKSVAIFGH